MVTREQALRAEKSKTFKECAILLSSHPEFAGGGTLEGPRGYSVAVYVTAKTGGFTQRVS